MTNTFYTDFDCECLQPRSAKDYRTPFAVDRDRIIYSAAFRRLQAKTQVFHSGEYDFYRTRLTHSLEVAQIGRSICRWLLSRGEFLREDFQIDADLVEAVCLAHDLGHPPYGHAGEATLHEVMRSHGGFEGNAQSLRILTETIYPAERGREGMKPTRALLDGVLKYKRLFRDAAGAKNHFLYDEQAACLDFAFGPGELTALGDVNKFRSIECQIMDWADDIAYSLMDVVDGVNAGLINVGSLEQLKETIAPEEEGWFDGLLDAIRKRRVENEHGRKVGQFIQACRLGRRENFMSARTNRYAFELVVDDAARREAAFYNRLSTALVFKSPQVQQLEFKGSRILRELFETFMDNYAEAKPRKNLLPHNTERRVLAESSPARKARIICDHIAGMTDGYAVRTHRRLFDAQFGSIADLT